MPEPEPIPVRERLILALDVPGPGSARELVEQLGDAVGFYKLGLELLCAGGYFDLVAWLRERSKRIFADLKLFDVPNTVAGAVSRLGGRGIDFLTVHGNDAMLEAACAVRPEGLRILAVTALTSLDERDMVDLGFRTDVRSLVLSRARRAVEIGCDGVIASGHEAAAVRGRLGRRPLIVVPGIRAGASQRSDDQKRTVDVEEALEAGADHIVVGRPIRQTRDPRATAEAIQRRIAAFFSARGDAGRGAAP